MSYFQDATVTYQGRVYHFPAEKGRALESHLNYWHRPGDPSSWLGVAVFERAREKVKGAPQRVALKLAAQAMGITVEKLRALIRWHEQYMRWHDGIPDYQVLKEEEDGDGDGDEPIHS